MLSVISLESGRKKRKVSAGLSPVLTQRDIAYRCVSKVTSTHP
jgi:hypothetical protein